MRFAALSPTADADADAEAPTVNADAAPTTPASSSFEAVLNQHLYLKDHPF